MAQVCGLPHLVSKAIKAIGHGHQSRLATYPSSMELLKIRSFALHELASVQFDERWACHNDSIELLSRANLIATQIELSDRCGTEQRCDGAEAVQEIFREVDHAQRRAPSQRVCRVDPIVGCCEVLEPSHGTERLGREIEDLAVLKLL